MKTERLIVDDRFGEEYQGLYELRQVTQGEYEDALLVFMDRAGRISRQNLLKVNREMLWISLVNQPAAKPLSLDMLLKGKVPHGLATKLQEAYDKVNGIQAEERDFLSEQSDEKSAAQSSQSSPSANASDTPQTSTEPQTAKQS